MKRISIFFVSVLVMVIGLSVCAHAALVDMHDGTIYETDTQLSWLKDAGTGGVRSAAEAAAWAAGLKVGGLTGWRLPNADPACGFSYNCRNGEMGHLYYVSLGNHEGRLTSTGPFINLNHNPANPFSLYWSGAVFEPKPINDESDPEPPGWWLFNFYDGNQLGGGQGGSYSAWAVRPGARSEPKPEPTGGTGGTGSDKDAK